MSKKSNKDPQNHPPLIQNGCHWGKKKTIHEALYFSGSYKMTASLITSLTITLPKR
jgi:hypothetical protein